MPLTPREWKQLKTAIEASISIPLVGVFGGKGETTYVMPRQNVLALVETFVEDYQPEEEEPPAKPPHHPDCKAVSVKNRKLASDISCDCGRNG